MLQYEKVSIIYNYGKIGMFLACIKDTQKTFKLIKVPTHEEASV
jgi:hypothetical protein